jgi:hypothetical protein
MNEQRPFDGLEERLQRAARDFTYPPAPDLAATVGARLRAEAGRRTFGRNRRRVAGLALAAALLCFGLLAVPQVRAAVGEIVIRIGAIRIFVPAPTATPAATPLPPTATLGRAQALITATPAPRPTSTPRPSPTIDEAQLGPLASLGRLAGETTLEAAKSKLQFPPRLPTYPADLGPPDKLFVQNLGPEANTAIAVWTVPGRPDQVRLSLWQIRGDEFAKKNEFTQFTISETSVHGRRAVWVRGSHMLQLKQPGSNNEYELGRLVTGNVLIWVEGEITYRLETTLPLEEAVKVAESLR